MTVNRRIDHLTALLVDTAVAIRATHGDIAAVRALLNHGIDKSIILRVISEPTSRRSISHAHLTG